jgi:class 3 adenylate cyclase/tetratricopeptide (TPR) repeat protein
VCAQCAAPLTNLCPSCGFENPPGFKFCGSCGASLVASTLPQDQRAATLKRLQAHIPSDLVDKILRVGQQFEGERRSVTILFTDVVGFTTLSEKLDPEQVFTIIEQVQQAFLAEIYTHEGWFDKFLGDGLMAIFGAPVAHEDDAVRAVRAALGMQSSLRRINDELDPALNVMLRIRIGLNAGTVVVATMGSDMKLNYTPLGDAVNVASRLQSIAEPGTVVVSRAVYEQSRPLFDFADLGAIRIKGRVEPVEIFQVSGPKRAPERARGIPGLHAPMVGREKEEAQVRYTVSQWLRAKDRRLALVTGEAGIGKSRLTAELKQQLPPQAAVVIEGACLAYGQSAYALFVGLLRQLFGVATDARIDTAREQIRLHVQTVLGEQAQTGDVLPYLAYLLSVPMIEEGKPDPIRYLEPSQLRQQIFLAVRDLLVAEARRQPLLLVCEDLHWVDSPSLDLLLFLVNATEGSPLLFFCTSRPESQSQALTQLERAGTALGTRYLRIDLLPLSPSDASLLVEQLLVNPRLPDQFKQTVQQRAEGNPFYLEETIRMLVDRGMIRHSENGWEPSPRLDLGGLEVPRTLQGLIMTRVDALPDEARNVLQSAAVIGRTFSKRLLHAVLVEDGQLDSDLEMLGDLELIAPVERGTEPEFSFRHVLIQETVYSSLLHRRRERLHRRTAEAIEQLYADRLDDHLDQLAFHYHESRAFAQAFPYLIRSAERSASRYANDAAQRYYQSAIEIIPTLTTTPEQRTNVYRGLGDVQHVVGDYDSALQSYRNSLELTRSLSEPPARQISELARKIGRVYERRGEYDESLRWLDTAVDELDRDPDSLRSVERMRIYAEMGWVYYRRGEMDKAYQWRMRSLEIGAGTDYYAEMGSAYNGLVPLFAAKGDWDRARAYATEGLRMRERIGDTEGTARCYLNLGNISVSQGDWGQAIDYNNRGLALAQRVGQTSTIFQFLNNLGYIYILRGDSRRAREFLARALPLAERSRDAHQICATLNNYVEVAIQEGNPDEALTMLERSQARAITTRNVSDIVQTHWLLALTKLALGDPKAAEEAARRALRTAEEAGLKGYEGRASRALGSICVAQNRLSEAEVLFQLALSVFQMLKDRYETARTDLELARLFQQRMDLENMRQYAEMALETFTALGAEADRKRALELTQSVAA